MLSEVVTCNCVRNPGGHAESNPKPSEEGVSFYHVLRPLDQSAVCLSLFRVVSCASAARPTCDARRDAVLAGALQLGSWLDVVVESIV